MQPLGCSHAISDKTFRTRHYINLAIYSIFAMTFFMYLHLHSMMLTLGFQPSSTLQQHCFTKEVYTTTPGRSPFLYGLGSLGLINLKTCMSTMVLRCLIMGQPAHICRQRSLRSPSSARCPWFEAFSASMFFKLLVASVPLVRGLVREGTQQAGNWDSTGMDLGGQEARCLRPNDASL